MPFSKMVVCLVAIAYLLLAQCAFSGLVHMYVDHVFLEIAEVLASCAANLSFCRTTGYKLRHRLAARERDSVNILAMQH